MATNSEIGFDNDDCDDWAPPTEAELKVIAARRERQEKVSKLLGQYLLKGYKMLGTTCSVCETILMRSKQNVDYCVTCNELDCDTTKDDPALNSDAARSQARERQLSYSQDNTDSSVRRTNGPSACDETDRQPMLSSSLGGNTSSAVQSPLSPTVVAVPAAAAAVTGESSPVQCASNVVASNALVAVYDQLALATDQLKKSSNIDTSKQICQLIKECADAALHLKQLLSH